MKFFIQYAIYVLTTICIKLFNLVINKNAYKRTSESANHDINNTNREILLGNLKKYHISRSTGPTKSICYAPSKSIYFGFGGKVVPCCFNREYIYGNFPLENVADIINGQKKRDLQQILNDQDFSKGCQHCRNQIISGNYQGVEARLYDKLNNKSDFPSEMIFEIDNTCNLECSMCDGAFSSSILKNRERKSEVISPYNSIFFEQIKPFLKHLSVAKFLGGEPFLIKGYYELWEELIKHNPKCFVNLQTNGTVYNSKIEDLLKRGRFQIGVSIDSLDPIKFSKIRKNASLSKVLENLDKFIKHSQKRGSFVNISVCPMQQNWQEIPDIIEFCNKKNVFIYFNTVYSEGFNLLELESSKLKEIISFYKNSEITTNTYIKVRNKRFFYDLINQIEVWYHNKYNQEQNYILKRVYSRESMIGIFKNKLSEDYYYYESIISEAISDLPKEILLSDYQKKLLDDIKKEDLVLALKNETSAQINKRLMNLIEFSTLRLENGFQ